MRSLVLLVWIGLYSCGSGGGSSENSASNKSEQDPDKAEMPNSMYLETKDDLPECTDSNKNALAYVADQSEFFYCKDSAWTIADIKGKDGKDGTDGKDGSNANSGIKKIFQCDGSADIDSTNDERYGSIAIVTEFNSGDFEIYCSVNFLSDAFGFFENHSQTRNWAKESSGVVNGEISCHPRYVSSFYDILNKSVTYVNQADSSQNETIVCDEIFPGI